MNGLTSADARNKPWLDLKELGSVVSDPREGSDTKQWNELLFQAAHIDPQLYVKLIGLRFAGMILKPDAKFGYRLSMVNQATVKANDVSALLTPHKAVIIGLIKGLK